MRIVHIVSGAGGMYCGSCMHAAALASAIRRAGQDIILLPAYTPIRTDGEDISADRLVFGGLNVYLQHRWGLFRRAPRSLDRLLDARWLVRALGRFSSTTRPEDLGPLTVSMLRGEEGRLRKELDKLIDWLAAEARPDVVHLSNVMLVGMTRQIARRLGVPVVCSLTGEDAFLDRLPEPYLCEAKSILRERCAELAALVALNRFYAQYMSQYLGIARERIDVIEPGLEPFARPVGEDATPRPAQPFPTIGFLSRIAPEKGLDRLVDAWMQLARDRNVPGVRLAAAGYRGRGERRYLRRIERRIERSGLADRFAYRGELDKVQKEAFLGSIDVFCLPAPKPESKAIPLLEAWAAGRPAVLPGHGAFREWVESTGGGLLYPPGNLERLVACLAQILTDRDLAHRLGQAGRNAVATRFTPDRMARETIRLYERVL